MRHETQNKKKLNLEENERGGRRSTLNTGEAFRETIGNGESAREKQFRHRKVPKDMKPTPLLLRPFFIVT